MLLVNVPPSRSLRENYRAIYQDSRPSLAPRVQVCKRKQAFRRLKCSSEANNISHAGKLLITQIFPCLPRIILKLVFSQLISRHFTPKSTPMAQSSGTIINPSHRNTGWHFRYCSCTRKMVYFLRPHIDPILLPKIKRCLDAFGLLL